MTKLLVDFLRTRRSSKPDLMGEPGPNAAELEQILTIAARVPDHKKLTPWRFIVVQGAARAAFGDVLANALVSESKEAAPSPMRLETERKRFLRSPVVVAVIARPMPNPAAPEWEQILSTGAACYNLCLAANGLGFASAWLTEWYAYSPGVKSALKLAAHEQIAGFVYVGTAREILPDRDRPALADIVSHWTS